MTGLGKENIQFPWANKKNTATSGSLEYFKDIGREKTEELFEIYRIDFEMFEYEVQDYFNIH